MVHEQYDETKMGQSGLVKAKPAETLFLCLVANET